jgi:hypothetical protein
MRNEPIIAEWRSKSGKYYCQLRKFESGVGYCYTGNGCSGTLAAKTDDEAIAEVLPKVNSGYFQPDAHKTPMKRVK